MSRDGSGKVQKMDFLCYAPCLIRVARVEGFVCWLLGQRLRALIPEKVLNKYPNSFLVLMALQIEGKRQQTRQDVLHIGSSDSFVRVGVCVLCAVVSYAKPKCQQLLKQEAFFIALKCLRAG